MGLSRRSFMAALASTVAGLPLMRTKKAEAKVPFVSPLIISYGASLKAGTEIRCENGHHQATVLEDIETGATNYASRFGDWKQPVSMGQRFPIRCARCNGILIDAQR